MVAFALLRVTYWGGHELDSRPSRSLEPGQNPRDPLLLVGVLGHRERPAVLLPRSPLVPLGRVSLAQAVVHVPALGIVLRVLLEHDDRRVHLALAQQLVPVAIDVRLGGDLE